MGARGGRPGRFFGSFSGAHASSHRLAARYPALNEKAVGCSRRPHGASWFPGHPILSSRPSCAAPFMRHLSACPALTPSHHALRDRGLVGPQVPVTLRISPSTHRGDGPRPRALATAAAVSGCGHPSLPGWGLGRRACLPSWTVLRPPSLNTSPEPHVCRHVPPAPRPLPVTISKKRHHVLESLALGFHHGRVLLSTVRPRTDSVCSMAPRGCHRAERPPPPGDLMAVILSQHNASRGDAGVAGPLPCPP